MKPTLYKQISAKSVSAIMTGMILSLSATVLVDTVRANPLIQVVPAAPSTIDMPPAYRANQVLVQFHTELAPSQRQQSVAALSGARMQHFSKWSSFTSVQLPANVTVEQAMLQYRKDPSVKHVQPNYIYHSTLVPDDNLFAQQWALQNNGQLINNAVYGPSNPGVSGRDMGVTEAWDTLTDCSSVIVAVIDTGIEYTHQDLAANMWDGSAVGIPNHGWDFVGVSDINTNAIVSDNDPAAMGGSEHHGTHVAATIGAVGNNTLGTAGLCWQVQLMSVRALDSFGRGTTLTIRDSIRFAADRGASVINMSLGFTGAFDQILSDAIDYARSKDVLTIVAAGNKGRNMDAAGSSKEYPCALTQDNLVCIAAVDQAFNRAGFSNYGVTSVDIAAPGTNILSAWGGMFIQDNFSTWTLAGGWARAANCVITETDALVNPSNWCASASPPFPTYAISFDDQATRSFDLISAANATLLMRAFVDTEQNADFFTLNTDATGGNPFDGVNDSVAISETGSAAKNKTATYEVAIDNCLTTTCNIGVRLQSNINDAANEGVGIAQLEILTLQPGGNTVRLLNGTSMATPHVSGVAAMVRAMNPSYTAVDTAAAIKAGGESVASLATLTLSGKVVNAAGSLVYINPPTGVSAVEVQ